MIEGKDYIITYDDEPTLRDVLPVAEYMDSPILDEDILACRGWTPPLIRLARLDKIMEFIDEIEDEAELHELVLRIVASQQELDLSEEVIDNAFDEEWTDRFPEDPRPEWLEEIDARQEALLEKRIPF